MIRYVEPVAIDAYWHIVAPMIEPALNEELLLEDVYNKLLNEKMGLISISDDGEIVAACVVEFVTYPRIRAMRVVALGGEKMKKWLSQLIEFLDTWAVENRMDRIEQMGRDGWTRVLDKYGYQERYTFMTKEYNYG